MRLAPTTPVLLNPSDLTIKLLHLMVNIFIPPNNLSSLNFLSTRRLCPRRKENATRQLSSAIFLSGNGMENPQKGFNFWSDKSWHAKTVSWCPSKLFIKKNEQSKILFLGVMNQFCLSLELNDKYQYQYYPTTGWDDGKMLLMLLRQNLFLQKNRSNTSQMEKYLFEPVVLVGSQAESTSSRTLKTCHVS